MDTSSGPILVIGIDYTFAFPGPRTPAGTPDDLLWVKDLLTLFQDTPAILVHHDLFVARAQNAGEFGLSTPAQHPYNTQLESWDHLVVPHPNVFMVINGHYIPAPPRNARFVEENLGGGRTVYRVFRNFQAFNDGWQMMMIFDPVAGKIRMRSYRVDSEMGYRGPSLVAQGLVSSLSQTHSGSVEKFLTEVDYGCEQLLQSTPLGDPPPDECEILLDWNLP